MGKKWRRFWVQHILWSSKILFCFEWRLNFFFEMVIFPAFFSTLPSVVKIANIVRLNVELHNVVATLLNTVNFNVYVHKVVSTLISRCATSLHHINLKTTLNQRWNVCWEIKKSSISKINVACPNNNLLSWILAYSKPSHIYNPWHIQNPGIFKVWR